jgi:hypothetical protein
LSLIVVSSFVVIFQAHPPLILQRLLSTGTSNVSSVDKARPQVVIVKARMTTSGGSSKLGRLS